MKRVIGLAALIVLVLNGQVAHVAAQTEWPNCENFRDQDDAQVTYDADQTDPFDLESSQTANDVPCEDELNFGRQPLASCDALINEPNALQALQGLYDYTRGEGDPYGLDQGGDPAIACDGDGGGDEREVLDGPPPDSGGNDQENLDGPAADRSRDDQPEVDGSPPGTSDGTTIVVIAAPLDDFASLEARLSAQFATLEADFAAFEARAQNGFGRFDESGDDTSVETQGPTVDVTALRRPAEMMKPTETTDVGEHVVRLQTAHVEETPESDPSNRQKARKASKSEQGKERGKSKRQRHNNGQHVRR